MANPHIRRRRGGHFDADDDEVVAAEVERREGVVVVAGCGDIGGVGVERPVAIVFNAVNLHFIEVAVRIRIADADGEALQTGFRRNF